MKLIQLPILERQASPEKPEFGQPCNGCGLCCAAETCGIARDFLHAFDAPCPAMEFADGRFWCGMVRRPAHYLALPEYLADDFNESVGALFGTMLGVGMGCDSDIAAVAKGGAR